MVLPENSFQYTITVSPKDIDGLNHVNNVVYVRWVQEAAEAHWDAIAQPDLRCKYAWVVLRHEIDYKSPAVAGDVIEAHTWVSSCEGVRSVRNVRLIHARSRLLVADAKTTWCLLDATTKKPKRIESDITSIFLV